MKLLAKNKKAFFNYEIIEQYIAGIQLNGREIKSLRQQKPSMVGAFVTISGGKPILRELNIPRYKHDTTQEHTPKRDRLLLMKKSEIERIESKLKGENLTVIPLSVNLDRQWAKITIALARGKKKHDKRRSIMERDQKRQAQRAVKKFVS